VVKYVKGRNPLINDLEGGANVDSDCEDDPIEAGDARSLKEEQGAEETRAALIVGSFSDWKSLFFYLCTDTISFAPLKSQGANFRLNHEVQELPQTTGKVRVLSKSKKSRRQAPSAPLHNSNPSLPEQGIELRTNSTGLFPTQSNEPCSLPETGLPQPSLVRKGTVAAAPPPCSPKSIYVLTSLLGLQPLCDSAFADIKSKVTLDNVVDEIFSWVTASHEKIMEMECELLISNFKGPKTTALIKENIGHISDGSSSYCAGALKLGLKKAFELKRQGLARLRCGYGGCPRYNNYVPYSTIGSNIYCPNSSHGNYYLQCVGCGYNRNSNCGSCQSCRKRFI